LGKEAIRGQLEAQASNGHQVTLLQSQTASTTATGKYALRSRSIAATGIDRIVFDFRIEEKAGSISLLTFSPDLGDPTTAAFFAGRGASVMQPPRTGDGGLIPVSFRNTQDQVSLLT
jgi:hypothetical protein